jgi:hypothetical protein
MSFSAFDPETRTILAKAFDAACMELRHASDDDLISNSARTLMVLAILRAAIAGERNFKRLKVLALLAADEQAVVGSLP